MFMIVFMFAVKIKTYNIYVVLYLRMGWRETLTEKTKQIFNIDYLNQINFRLLQPFFEIIMRDSYIFILGNIRGGKSVSLIYAFVANSKNTNLILRNNKHVSKYLV